MGLSDFLHQSCLSFVHSKNQYGFIQQSLICGLKLPPSSFKLALQNLGIIHLFVVSGFHIQTISSALNHALKRFPFVTPLLTGLFTLTCNLNPPVTRAFTQIFASSFNKRLKLFWTQNQKVYLSAFFCLSLFPHWLFSTSFLLSWSASLCIKIPVFTELTGLKKHLAFHSKIYFLLLPLISEFQALSPISILINFVFAPVFTYILFPLSILSGFIPYLNSLHDFLWHQVFILTNSILPTYANAPTQSYPIFYKWIYIALLHTLFATLEKRKIK